MYVSKWFGNVTAFICISSHMNVIPQSLFNICRALDTLTDC